MRHFVIFDKNGSWREIHTHPENKPEEYPPPHGLNDGDVGVEIIDDGELPGALDPHEELKDFLHGYAYRGGKLEAMEGRKTRRSPQLLVIEKMRMRNRALEDRTTTGWRRRVIFEAFTDPDGSVAIDSKGRHAGRYLIHRPRKEIRRKRANGQEWVDLVRDMEPIDAPEPEDRQVLAGVRGVEAPTELRAPTSSTAREWLRIAGIGGPQKEEDHGN